MHLYIRKIDYKHLLILVIILYFLFNLVTLMTYPFIHSDETWLMGLTKQAVSERSFQVTEPFFDTYPRAIHGLRVVFILLQALALKFMGGGVFSVRLLSLTASTITLYLIGSHARSLGHWTGLLLTIILATNIQYILHAHSGRQEALILLIMVLCFLLVDKLRPFWIGSLIGIAMGIHPNSFIIACGLGLYYLMAGLKAKKAGPIIEFIITLILWAAGFIMLSLYLNPRFFSEYLAYGQTQGVNNFEIGRFKGFFYFYYKLYHQIGGTYLLEDLKGVLILQGISLVIGLGLFFIHRNDRLMKPLAMVLGINIGILIIGRYNQTSIIFPIVFAFLLLFTEITRLKKPLLYGLLSILLLSQFQITYRAMTTYENDDYYALEEALTIIPTDSVVLANINLLEHVPTEKLYDYRNLWDFDGEDLMAYLASHDIEYIVWPEEMDYIHDMPMWHILYGPMAYYEPMKNFLETQELIYEFTSPTYGMRIAKYVNTYPWSIKIYKVENSKG